MKGREISDFSYFSGLMKKDWNSHIRAKSPIDVTLERRGPVSCALKSISWEKAWIPASETVSKLLPENRPFLPIFLTISDHYVLY